MPAAAAHQALPERFLLFIQCICLLKAAPRLFKQKETCIRRSEVMPEISPQNLTGFLRICFIKQMFIPVNSCQIFFLLHQLVCPDLVTLKIRLLFHLPDRKNDLLHFFHGTVCRILQYGKNKIGQFSFRADILPEFLCEFDTMHLFFHPCT